MEEANCNLCGGNNNAEIYNDGRFRIVMCDDCSLVYLNPRPTEDEYKEYYSKDYQRKRHHVTEYSQVVEKIEKKNSYVKKEKRAEDFLKYINSDSKVLDVGSGWGTMLQVIKDRYNCQVAGVEISELAVKVSREYYGLDVFHQTFEEYLKQDSNRQFDFILMVHVLEHFSDPVFILNNLAKILSNNGYLYIAVPNLAKPDEPFNTFFRMEHCFYFAPLTLRDLLNKCDYKIIEIKASQNDLRVIAAKKESNALEIIQKNIESEYSKEKVKKIIKRQLRKYGFLRFGQKIFKKILPQKIFVVSKKIILKILRKFKII